MKARVIMRVTVGLAVLCLCQGVSAVYIGYDGEDCTGEEHEFEDYEELTRSTNPKILSYKDEDDEEDECFEALPMEEMVVTGVRIPSTNYLLGPMLGILIYRTPAGFYDSSTSILDRPWTDEDHWQPKVEGMEECWRTKAANNRSNLASLDSDIRMNFEAAMNTRYDVYADSTLSEWTPSGIKERLGYFFVDGSVRQIRINGPAHLKYGLSLYDDFQPGFAMAQTHIHEALHVARTIRKWNLGTKEEEERKVQKLAYEITKALWGVEPPLGYAEEGTKTPKNSNYNKDALDLEDLCQ